jgi:hypothetical protein
MIDSELIDVVTGLLPDYISDENVAVRGNSLVELSKVKSNGRTSWPCA